MSFHPLTEKSIKDTCYIYPEEIQKLNNFLAEHWHEQPGNFVVSNKYVIEFHRTSVAVFPVVRCWCGKSLEISCKERLNSV